MGCTHRRGREDGEGEKGGKFQEYPGAAGYWDALSVLGAAHKVPGDSTGLVRSNLM